MPYIKGKATSLQDLLDKTVAWVTDTAIHGDDAWELMRHDPWPRGTIFKAKGVNGINSCYIGLLLMNHVKGESYRNWLLQTKNLMKHIVLSNRALNLAGQTILHSDGSASFYVLLDKFDAANGRKSYTLSDVDIVDASGTALVFGVFKQYEAGLDWNEQPGAIEFSNLGQYPISYTVEGSATRRLDPPPIYPGVGYPGIGMPKNEPAYGSFDYWLIKDASRITIVTKNIEQWDIGHAGMLVPYQSAMQYAFPAVVAGSCTGLNSVGQTVGSNEILKGGMIDYSYLNGSMSRAMLCCPCANIAASSRAPENTQVGLCLPDGKWQFFNNFTQTLQTKSRINSTAPYFALNRPVRVDSQYTIKPNNDLTAVTSCFADDDTITIESFDLVENVVETATTNMFGSLWGMYWPGVNYRYGEVEIEGKKHLILPNCWQDRTWYIPNHYNDTLSDYSLFLEDREITAYGKQFKMLIRLEE